MRLPKWIAHPLLHIALAGYIVCCWMIGRKDIIERLNAVRQWRDKLTHSERINMINQVLQEMEEDGEGIGDER